MLRAVVAGGGVADSADPAPQIDARGFIALNDVVFTRRALSRMVEVSVWVGDQFVTTVKADGLIIASPTGSTAYNLSAGGPIVHPALDALIITPIAPHMLSNRPIVIPAEREVRVVPAGTNAGDDIYVTFDGQIRISPASGTVRDHFARPPPAPPGAGTRAQLLRSAAAQAEVERTLIPRVHLTARD